MIHAYVHECTLIGRGMYTQMHRMQIENVFPFRVDVYARMYERKKKKKKCSVEHGQWFIVLSNRQWQCVGLSNLVADEISCRSTMEWKIEKILIRLKRLNYRRFLSFFRKHSLSPIYCIIIYFNKFFSIFSSKLKHERKSSLILV